MTRGRFIAGLLAILALATLLRTIYPVADPPWQSTVGVVWHDEGAWTHNARNKALFGAWRQDEWNPVYIAPVFTAFEYLSFTSFGVGVWQARLVSEVAGVLSVLLLALGVRRIAGPLAGVTAGALLATNYVYVMYDRAAIMEALMVALIVASWYCSTRAEKAPAWGALAGVCATLAFFTKAAAAFYIGALGLVAVIRFAEAWAPHEAPLQGRRIALWTLGGLAASGLLIGLLFVLPHWSDYQFYNWQMSVTRKPSYDLASIVTRFTWLPILHDTFSRMWAALALGVIGGWGVVLRRFVFLIPALIALASMVLARGSLLPACAPEVRRKWLLLATPVLLYSAYVLLGPLTRVPFLERVYAHELKMPVRLAAAGALVLSLLIVAQWERLAAAASRPRWTARTVGVFLVFACGWNTAQFVGWASRRTYENYEASRMLATALPPETLVQGKLANGLALENRIRPIFIGHQFGNYADRKQRWDVRYILTYTDPELGYEGDQILDVLAAYPGWRTIMTFDVAETPSGHDKAALIEKRARH